MSSIRLIIFPGSVLVAMTLFCFFLFGANGVGAQVRFEKTVINYLGTNYTLADGCPEPDCDLEEKKKRHMSRRNGANTSHFCDLGRGKDFFKWHNFFSVVHCLAHVSFLFPF